MPIPKKIQYLTEPAVRYRNDAVEEHSVSESHFVAEKEEQRDACEDVAYLKTFMSYYWLAKEEIATCKATRLLKLTKENGDGRHWPN